MFPPIADYCFLSDCESMALVAPDGSVEWLCLPRPDASSVFGALLDRTAGFMRFGPAHVKVPNQRRYVPGTNALETTWHTKTGWLTVTDLLVMQPTPPGPRRIEYRRVPGDVTAQGTLLRIASCTDGHVDLMLDCLPLFDYGRAESRWTPATDDDTQVVVQHGDIEMRCNSSMRLERTGARTHGHTTLHHGDTAFVALSWGPDPGPSTIEEALNCCEHTQKYWRDWLGTADIPDHRFRPYIERSALALKGLSYAPTGAVLAAATTSLPETVGGERNWDYRYSWVRDSSFMLRALHGLKLDWEAFEYFEFMIDAMRSADDTTFDIQIMFGIGGERDLSEQTLDHLSGYRNSRPVRIGNGAYDQRQNDVWGMVLDSLAIHLGQGGQVGPNAWAMLAALVDDAIAASAEPDQGIWEMRGPPRFFVASKVMCWIALDRGVLLARDRDDDERATRWQAAADALKAEICERGLDKRNVFVQHYDTTELDASALLIPLMGFLPPDDERVRATVLAIADELTEDGLVLRYRLDQADDGLANEPEGTFTICSFWLVSALAMIGEVDRARVLFEKLLSFAGPLLLYAEEIDAPTGLHLGNFPQAFTHLALIDAAQRLIECEDRAR